MGTFSQTIEVAASSSGPFEAIEATVDTGATYTWLPTPLLGRLGAIPLFRWSFLLADGRETEREVGQVVVRLDGRTLFTVCVFGDEGTKPLLGAVTREEFGLAVDPVRKRLVPVPGLLL